MPFITLDETNRLNLPAELLERLGEDGDQRQEEKEHQEGQRENDEHEANHAAFVAMPGAGVGASAHGFTAHAAAPPRGGPGR